MSALPSLRARLVLEISLIPVITCAFLCAWMQRLASLIPDQKERRATLIDLMRQRPEVAGLLFGKISNA
jgi:hypothetical protein